jgi:hypothetical protein
MIQRRVPLLFGLAAAALLLLRGPAQPLPGPPAASAAANPVLAAVARAGGAGAETKEPKQPLAPAAAGMAASRREYARLYRELLDVETPQPTAAVATQVHGTLAAQPLSLEISPRPDASSVSDDDLKVIAKAAREGCYHLEFMIALASDPIDSGLASDFDLTMSALQIGLADASYRLDSQWLPWVEAEAAEKKAYRQTAGMMLFHRRSPSAPEHHLLAVFVVGETLKLGIHKTAFENAVNFILALHAQDETLPSLATPGCGASHPQGPAASHLEIPVLGPTSSGSVASLRLALSRAAGGWFSIVSGSASAPGLKQQLEAPLPSKPEVNKSEVKVWFRRTVVPDDILASHGLRFLQDHLGWNLHKAALLVERDTAYGSYFSGLSTDSRPNDLLAKVTKLSFPSGLFALRNAWEASTSFAPPPAIAGNPQAIATPKTALDVSLADQRTPVDVVPELSPLTARIYDMAIADLLRQISREGYSYIGILATDVKDQLFLAEQIRRSAPSVILFVADNNLLYVHPQYNTTTFGMLTISSYPLVTEGRLPVASPSVFDPRVRRQFASERQEGTYFAVRTLLGQPPASPPAVWITASGNDAMWPLAKIIPAQAPEDALPPPWQPKDVESLGPLSPALELCERRPAVRQSRERTDLTMVFMAFIASLVSYLLRRDAHDWAATQVLTRALWSCAAALLFLAGACLLGLWIVKLWADLSAGTASVRAWLLLAPQAAACGYLAWSLLAWPALEQRPPRASRVRHHRVRRLGVMALSGRRWQSVRAALRRLGILVALSPPVLLLAGLAVTVAVLALWQVDAAGLFYYRARAFSGGITPLVSLAWLGAACFFWLVVELKRQWVRRRHEVTWPLIHLSDPVLDDCRARAIEIHQRLRPTLPPDGMIWLTILAIVVPPVAFLWSRMQPIGESRRYGLVFLVLAAGLSVLSTMAFLRFLRVWMILRAMLHRIEQTDLLPALKDVADEIDWRPTRLTWYEPSFTALSKSVERLQRLIDWNPELWPVDQRQEDLSPLLAAIIRAASEKRFSAELSSRATLNDLCNRASKLLAGQHWQQAVKDFYAVRLIAWLRHVFNQLRYSVLGAVGCGMALIVGTSTYAFQPKGFATLTLWAVLAAASATLLAIYLQMERDKTLSAIGRTEAGKVTYDWHFLSKILLYIVPFVGLVASQFPSAGRLFSSLLDPLLRVMGTGG